MIGRKERKPQQKINVCQLHNSKISSLDLSESKWQEDAEYKGGTLFVNTDYIMLFGRKMKDEIGATCSMYEENRNTRRKFVPKP